jgi:hypothetical protein
MPKVSTGTSLVITWPDTTFTAEQAENIKASLAGALGEKVTTYWHESLLHTPLPRQAPNAHAPQPGELAVECPTCQQEFGLSASRK